MPRTHRTPSAIKSRVAAAAHPPKKREAEVEPPTAQDAILAEADEKKESAQAEQPKRGRPRDPNINRTASKNRGLQPGLERFTVAVSETVLQDMRDYAYTVRLPLTPAYVFAR